MKRFFLRGLVYVAARQIRSVTSFHKELLQWHAIKPFNLKAASRSLALCLPVFAAGCAVGCNPYNCAYTKDIMAQLNPVAVLVGDSIANGFTPTADLGKEMNRSLPIVLPLGATLSQVQRRPASGYVLELPTSQEEVPVTYSVQNGLPSLSFKYARGQSVGSCFWEFDNKKWTCIRR